MPVSELWFAVPGDPAQNTGGYRYVRRLVEALQKAGTRARIAGLEGRFPEPDHRAEHAMHNFLAALPDGAPVVLDGLAMGAMPEVLQRHRDRLRLMALVHHPLADETGLDEHQQAWFQQTETLALAQVGRVFTTSAYTAARVQQLYGVSADRIVTVQPAVDEVFFAIEREAPVEGALSPPRLLCVGHLSARKAQHQLVQALHTLVELPWQCALVGSSDRDPGYARTVIKDISERGLAGRIELLGELDDQRMVEAYGKADLFVFPSLYEGYGMVIDEALAAGLPVLSSDGGALALTTRKPGACTYRVGRVAELADRLRALLTNATKLQQLTAQAIDARKSIRTWSDTARDFLNGLERGHPGNPTRFSGQWLELREPADHAARCEALSDTLGQWLMSRYDERSVNEAAAGPLQFVDIGTGRGSNPGYLIPRLPVPQQWTLVEPDQRLLKIATDRVEALNTPAEAFDIELTAGNLDSVLPINADLITASALIDLVSAPWLAALASALVARRSAVLVVLSYSGRFELTPAHPSDALLQNLVNRHQHGNKGSGDALGPEASSVLAQHLHAAGYRVEQARSCWRLGEDPGDARLIDMLMVGWAKAACEQEAGAAAEVDRWLQDRQAQLTREELKVSVSHLDLLALPGAEENG